MDQDLDCKPFLPLSARPEQDLRRRGFQAVPSVSAPVEVYLHQRSHEPGAVMFFQGGQVSQYLSILRKAGRPNFRGLVLVYIEAEF